MKPGDQICIVTPGALGSNPRVVKEAQTLQEAGYRVTVIATRTLDFIDRWDEGILAGATWRTHRIDFRSRPVRYIRRAVQTAHACAFSHLEWGNCADRGFSMYTAPLASAAVRVSADLYLAHYPAALPAVASAAHHHDAHYAFDAEDFHLGDHADTPEHRTEKEMIRSIEGRYLPGCAYVSAASPGIAEAYASTYRIPRPTVLLNVFPRMQAPVSSTIVGSAMPGPSVYWFSQTIGPERGLECAARAIGLARSRPHLYLRGSPSSGFVERLRQIAADMHATDRVHILPPAPPSEMERLAGAYDLGFVGETGHTTNRRLALTNKIFSYLLAGLPMVISDVPAHVLFAKDAGDAAQLFAADDARSLATAFDQLLENPQKLAAARAKAFSLGQTRFNWETEKPLLLNVIRNLEKTDPNVRKSIAGIQAPVG